MCILVPIVDEALLGIPGSGILTWSEYSYKYHCSSMWQLGEIRKIGVAVLSTGNYKCT